MPRLRNKKHEAFAQAIATGQEGSATYRKLFGYTGKHANSQSARLSATVSKRILEIQRQVGSSTFLTIAEKRAFYAEALRCKVSELPVNSRLVQSIKKVKRKVKGKAREEIIEIKTVDKLKAIEDDSRLAGDLVEKVEHSGGIDQNVSGSLTVDLPEVMLRPRPTGKKA